MMQYITAFLLAWVIIAGAVTPSGRNDDSLKGLHIATLLALLFIVLTQWGAK